MPKVPISLLAPTVAEALKEIGVDKPLEAVKKRLRSRKARLVLPVSETRGKAHTGGLGAAPAETGETAAEKAGTSANDFAGIRPLSVRISVSKISRAIRDAAEKKVRSRNQ